MKEEKEIESLSTWVVKLGKKAKILVKKGEKVEKNNPLALKIKEHTARVSFPSWIGRTLGSWCLGGKKTVGQKVAKKEILFEKKDFWGRSLYFLSPVSGEISGLNEKEGFLEIIVESKEEKLFSPVSGKVTRAQKGEIAVSFVAWRILGRGKGKGAGWGELRIIKKPVLTSLTNKHKGKVLLIDKIESSLLEKGAALGVAAFICFQEETDLERFSLPVLTFLGKKAKKEIRARLFTFEGQQCFVDPRNDQALVCLEQ